MVDIAQPLTRRASSWRAALGVVGALIAIGVLLRITDPQKIAAAQNFVLVFSSLLIEAMPFILIGAIVSAFIEVFVPASAFEKLTGLPRPLQLPVSALAGLAFPVCECGSVPVARRLVSKGLAPSAAITFMLAAPIINPVVLASTYVAYRGRDTLWPILLGRAGLGLVAAMAVGWVVSNRSKGELLRPIEGEPEHVHDGSKPGAFFKHLASDFVFMGRYLVLGAVVAALLQTFIPQSAVGSIAGAPGIDILAMMGLAFLLSLCSESDAFVAASFVQFGVGAQLAFLVFGPMVDTKLGILYSATFNPRFFRTVAVVVGAVTFAGALWIEVLFG